MEENTIAAKFRKIREELGHIPPRQRSEADPSHEIASLLAVRLDKVARHAEAAATFLRGGKLARGAAHALAAQGIIRRAETMLTDLAERFADKIDA